jgi:hypothetical protein
LVVISEVYNLVAIFEVYSLVVIVEAKLIWHEMYRFLQLD